MVYDILILNMKETYPIAAIAKCRMSSHDFKIANMHKRRELNEIDDEVNLLHHISDFNNEHEFFVIAIIATINNMQPPNYIFLQIN